VVPFLDLTRLFQPSTFEEDAEDWIFRLDWDDVEVECDFDHPKGGDFKWGRKRTGLLPSEGIQHSSDLVSRASQADSVQGPFPASIMRRSWFS
jgi:hypothetical protein